MTKGFQKIEMESIARLRRNAILYRSVQPSEEEKGEFRRVLGLALMLSALTGAAACRSWIANEARRAARATGAEPPPAAPARVPTNIDDLAERLADDPLTARVGVSAESASSVMADIVVDQVAKRGDQYTYGFSPDQVKESVRMIEKGHHAAPDPIIRGMMQRIRQHARIAELVARQALYIAYNDAVVVVASTPEGMLRFPLWEIRETIDEVTRGNPAGKYPEPHRHFQFSGYVHSIERIVSQRIVPPNGFNCRAEMVPMNHAACDKRGFLLRSGQPDESAIRAWNAHRQDLIDSGQYPDSGWVRPEA